MILALAVAVAATALSAQPERAEGFAQAERLVRERFPAAVLRRIDHEHEDGRESLEAELILDGRKGFLQLRWDDRAGWGVSSATWRPASSRYRRLLSRIEQGSSDAISVASAIAIVRERYPRALVSEIELDFRGTRVVYAIEMREGLVEFEAYVDALTGRVEEDPNGAEAAPASIDSLFALLPGSCDEGVALGFRSLDGVMRVVTGFPADRIDSGSQPACDLLREKLVLIARLFRGLPVELIEGSLREDGGWVFTGTARMAAEVVTLRVDAARGTVLVEMGEPAARP